VSHVARSDSVDSLLDGVCLVVYYPKWPWLVKWDVRLIAVDQLDWRLRSLTGEESTTTARPREAVSTRCVTSARRRVTSSRRRMTSRDRDDAARESTATMHG
jgi:hypothetical protein